MSRTIPRLLWLAFPMAYLLYFYELGGKGMLGPDEPRYASIARQMAWSGDWITPVLWGHAWFEKPPLLYWMNAAAFKLGLGPDVAPRLPVAVLSVAFLVFYWWILRREFGCRAAWMSSLILGTCGAWIGFSQVGVTDLPLAATFSAAILLALPWIEKGDARFLPAASALLGLAVLAKSLVPLALCAPLALEYRKARDLVRVRVLLPFAAIAIPWYALCYARNGRAFLDELFWKQQFQRVVSNSLQHQQHWWYYLPVLVGLALPWSPLLGLVGRRSSYGDARRRFLLATVVWGTFFFSIAVNKLAGYLLPLFPAAAALMGVALDQARGAQRWLAACAVMLVSFPMAAALLPAALAAGGLSKAHLQFQPLWLWPLALVPVVWILEMRGQRLAAVACVAAGATLGTVLLKRSAPAELDRIPSARVIWSQVAARANDVCVDGIDRGLEYGLNYYAGRALADCSVSEAPVHIRELSGRPYVTGLSGAAPMVDRMFHRIVISTVRD